MLTVEDWKTIALALACSDLDPRGALEAKVDDIIGSAAKPGENS